MSMNASFLEQVRTPGALSPEELAQAQKMYEEILFAGDTHRVTGRLARIYAEALLQVAEARGLADAIQEQFDSLLLDVYANSPRLERYLDSPVTSRKQKDEVLRRLFEGRAEPLFLNFLRLLNRKERLGFIRFVAVAYRKARELKANRV